MAVRPAPKRPNDAERRSMPRAATQRPAHFGAAHGGAFLRGTVVNLSPNGVCIHTFQPLEPGTAIEIEVASRDDGTTGEAMLVRGEVVRVDAIDTRISAMGVQLRVRLPRAGGVPALEGHSEAQALIEQLATELRASPASSEQTLEWSVLAEQEARSVRYRPVPLPRRRGLRLAFAILFLLLLTLATAWLARSVLRPEPADGSGSSHLWRIQQPPLMADASPAAYDSLPLHALRAALATDTPPLVGLEASAQLLDARRPEAALAAYNQLAGRRGAAPVEDLQVHLGRAGALVDLGRNVEAQSAIADAAGRATEVPDAWQRVVADWRIALEQGISEAPRMQRRVDLSKAMDALQESKTPPGARRIVVNTRDYLLTVYEGKRILAVFPVGLGFEDATPTGSFTIANMIEDPDWYNRGDVIKAGDPSNPLGAFWMGLGDSDGATPYGIHPTNEPGSIGAKQSRGCIRMRPADAAQVFGWCRVGTPVLVGP